MTRPALWIGAGVAVALAFAWSGRSSRIAEQADAWQRAATAPSSEVPAPTLGTLELPLHVYDSHLAQLRFAPSASAVLAFGSEGAMLRSTDDGQTWEPVRVPTREFLVSSVVDARSSALVVFGTRGAILRSEDAGQSFSAVRVDTERNFRAAAASADGSQILAVGDQGMAYLSRDGGKSFALEETPRSDYLSQVVALPKRARFVVGGDNGTLLLRDEGAGWRAVTTGAAGMVMSLAVSPDGKVLAGTQNGLILSSEDEGETFREAYKVGSESYAASFSANDSGSVVVARMRRGDLAWSKDHAQSFASVAFAEKPEVATLTWFGGRGFIGLGAKGRALSSDLTGERWSSDALPDVEQPLAMAVAPNTQTVLVVGASGLIARSTDRGRHYRVVRPALGGSLRAFADDSPAGCLVAVGLGATLVRSLDAGKSWQRVGLGIAPKLELTSVTVEPKTRALIVGGAGGTLLRSSDCGGSWSSIDATKGDVSFVLSGESSSVFALPAKSEILRSTDTGLTFARAKMEADAVLKCAVALSASELVAVGEGGRIYRSSDDGLSFQRVASGTEATLRDLGHDRVHNVSWAVGDQGTVLRSVDRGLTWARISVPTEENLFVIGTHPEGGVVWVGGNHGVVLRSNDGGEHFTSVPSGSTQTIRVIHYDPLAKEFVVAGTATLLRTMGGSSLVRVEANIEGRIDAALFEQKSGAMFLGGERLMRLGG